MPSGSPNQKFSAMANAAVGDSADPPAHRINPMMVYGVRRSPSNGCRSENEPIQIWMGEKAYGSAISNATSDAGRRSSLIIIRFSVLSMGTAVSATATLISPRRKMVVQRIACPEKHQSKVDCSPAIKLLPP
jgi:hypothetical protein